MEDAVKDLKVSNQGSRDVSEAGQSLRTFARVKREGSLSGR
jgi:hypothetical protein